MWGSEAAAPAHAGGGAPRHRAAPADHRRAAAADRGAGGEGRRRRRAAAAELAELLPAALDRSADRRALSSATPLGPPAGRASYGQWGNAPVYFRRDEDDGSAETISRSGSTSPRGDGASERPAGGCAPRGGQSVVPCRRRRVGSIGGGRGGRCQDYSSSSGAPWTSRGWR
jgi:hypothetical protein